MGGKGMSSYRTHLNLHWNGDVFNQRFVASSGYLHLYFCNLYWKCERPRIVCCRLVAYHCNFGKYFKRGNEPNFWGHGVQRLGKLIWYNETFATSADSDQLTHPHENGRYNLHTDYYMMEKQINKNRSGVSSNYTKELRLTWGCTCWSHNSSKPLTKKKKKKKETFYCQIVKYFPDWTLIKLKGNLNFPTDNLYLSRRHWDHK